jgi:hypothetical protein
MPLEQDRARHDLSRGREAAQQHACTTYQALLQTPLMVPAVGSVKLALAALEK